MAPVLLIVLALGSALNAAEGFCVEWHWMSPDTEISFYRYRLLDDECWIVQDSKTTSFTIEDCEPGRSYTLLLESSYDGLHWSETAMQTKTVPSTGFASARIDTPEIDGKRIFSELPLEKKGRQQFEAKIYASAASVGIYDFYNGHEIEDAKYLTITKPGFSLGFGFGYGVAKHIWLTMGYRCYSLWKTETVIPSGYYVSHHIASLGMDIRSSLSSKAAFVAGLYAGCMMSTNAGKYSISAVVGIDCGFEFEIDEILFFRLGTGFATSYQHSDERLYRSMTYIFDGLTSGLALRF